jgi:cbb3-type cytochrome oxidase subunit 3
MNRLLVHLPLVVTVVAGALLLAHGPIAQLAHYHEFADQSSLPGVAHAADVLSNLGFAVVAAWGMLRLRAMHNAGRRGYWLFLAGLLLTAFGSGFYHLAPDNARLAWDRLPIALACAGLLAGVRAECLSKPDATADSWLLGMFAVFSVGWWYFTEQRGTGDLRPYLLLQCLPLVLIPLWQWIYRAPRRDRIAFGCALALYVAAKCAELADHQVLAALGVASGHTVKHLLATAAAAVIVARLVDRQNIKRV